MLAAVQYGNDKWNSLKAPEEMLYPWDPASTYIKSPPFFHTMVGMLLVLLVDVNRAISNCWL